MGFDADVLRDKLVQSPQGTQWTLFLETYPHFTPLWHLYCKQQHVDPVRTLRKILTAKYPSSPLLCGTEGAIKRMEKKRLTFADLDRVYRAIEEEGADAKLSFRALGCVARMLISSVVPRTLGV